MMRLNFQKQASRLMRDRQPTCYDKENQFNRKLL